MENAASKGFSTATDLADWLVKNINIPFREAHKITGQIVKIAERNGCDLSDLSLGELQEVNQFINKDVYSVLSIKNSINSRDSYGGTSPKEVKKQIVNWKKKMSK